MPVFNAPIWTKRYQAIADRELKQLIEEEQVVLRMVKEEYERAVWQEWQKLADDPLLARG